MVRRAKAGAASDTKGVALSVTLPASVVTAVKVRAAERGETLRQTVLRALQADGFKIPEREIVDRRADANKERGRLRKRSDRYLARTAS
jgi:hypothetical protein